MVLSINVDSFHGKMLVPRQKLPQDIKDEAPAPEEPIDGLMDCAKPDPEEKSHGNPSIL